MPKQKLFIIIASCLLVVGIVGVLFTYKSSGAEDEVTQKKVINNPDITNIMVETDNATVEVLPTTDEQITVAFSSSKAEKNNYKLQIKEKDQTLSVELKEKVIQFLFFRLDFSFKGPKVTVYLPEKQYNQLHVDVENGRVFAENVKVANTSIDTENGRVQLVGMVTERTDVSSENGSIIFDHVEGRISSEVENGSTTLITDNLDRSIDLESENGRIRIQTENEPTNAIITAQVENGRVDIFGNDTRSVVYGDGENRITLKSENGSIKVYK